MMSLDEAIKHAEEVATEQERLMGRYDAASGYARSGNESIRTESAKECEQCAAEHRQLAELLRELQERRKEPTIQPELHWIPVSERLPSKEERKEWIDNNLDGIGYLYPCLVTRYSSINPDRTKNNPYVAKHYFDGEDFLNAGEEVRSEYIIAWMPLPEAYKPNK